MNYPPGDEGEEGGGGRWRAVEDGGGKHREVRLLPDFQRADLTLQPQCPSALDRQHPQRILSIESRGRGLGQRPR